MGRRGAVPVVAAVACVLTLASACGPVPATSAAPPASPTPRVSVGQSALDVHADARPDGVHVGWSSDGASRHSVYYSRDGGTTWHMAAVELSGSGTVFPAGTLPGGDLVLTVVAGHQAPTGGARAAVTVANNPPGLVVLTPGTAIVWSSDRDGVIGTGETLTLHADELSLGRHTIAATATDAAGATITVHRRIRVTRTSPLPSFPADLG